MPADIFMKIDGIKGESVDATHKEEIDVLGWNWKLSQSGTAHSGSGAGAGRANIGDLVFTKFVDKASPTLMKFCCAGKHFPVARLTVRKAGGKPVESLKLTLKNGLVSSVTVGGIPDEDQLLETVSINFASFTLAYAPQLSDGSTGPASTATWNIAKNAES